MLIINDETKSQVTHPTTHGRGLVLPEGFAASSYAGVADPFSDEWLIPRHEWQARIQEMEERQSRISDMCRIGNLPCKNQSNTNLCWANAPTHCIEIIRLQQNQPKVILSPASVGGPVTGYANRNGNPAGVGGWGLDALKFIVNRGAVPVDLWPANDIDPQRETTVNKAIAMKYRTPEWNVLEPRSIDQLVSVLLRRIPVAVGYNWWGHEVTAVDAAWMDGGIAIRIRNSWGMSWGDAGGYAVLQGNKMLPDDAVCPRTAIAA